MQHTSSQSLKKESANNNKIKGETELTDLKKNLKEEDGQMEISLKDSISTMKSSTVDSVSDGFANEGSSPNGRS